MPLEETYRKFIFSWERNCSEKGVDIGFQYDDREPFSIWCTVRNAEAVVLIRAAAQAFSSG